MQEEHVRQRESDDYHFSHSLTEEKWKYYNSYRLNLNIDIPKVVSNKMKALLDNPKLLTAVNVFVCNLLARKYRFTLSYSRSGHTQPRSYNKRKISGNMVIKAADWLVANGYALEQRGKASPDAETRYSSYLWATDKLLSMFDEAVASHLHDSYIATNNYIVLKDKNKTEIDYKQTKEVSDMALDMESINKHNSRFLFTDYEGNDLNCSSFTRIFNEDFMFGGRLYRTDAHSLKHNGVDKTVGRLGISIDLQPVVEVDFSNLHAMMLCAIEKIHTAEYHGDMYEYILRYVEWDTEPQDRKLIKQAFNIMLNCESSTKAMQAIQGLINNQPHNQDRYTIRSGGVIWKTIYQVMEPFQKYFDNPDKIGMRLQRMDSDIAVRVCNHFVSRNRPVIPVHDSFIVWDIDGDMLLRSMVDAFKKVTGCPSNFPVFFHVESAYFPTEKVVMY